MGVSIFGLGYVGFSSIPCLDGANRRYLEEESPRYCLSDVRDARGAERDEQARQALAAAPPRPARDRPQPRRRPALMKTPYALPNTSLPL
jgi:hypothetical protein